MLTAPKQFLLLFLELCLLILSADAGCKSQSASFKKNEAPTVHQPSTTDSNKVMVSWTRIINNPRCVDKYTLLVYPAGMDKNKGEKYEITDNSIVSKMINVEPCIQYLFELEYFEDEFLISDHRGTAKIAEYRTDSKALLISQDRSKFKVGYVYDRINNVLDFSKAAIRFPKSLIKNPSCIKHVEVEGKEVIRASGRSNYNAQSSARGQVATAGFGRSRTRGRPSYNSGQSSSGGSGSYPGPGYPSSSGSASYPGHSSSGGSGSYPGSGYPSSSGSGSYPGHSSSGGSGSYPGSGYPGSGYPSSSGSGSYPGHSSSGGSGSYPGHSSGGGSGSYPGSGYPSSSGSSSYPGHSSGGGSGSYPGSGYPSSSGSGSYPGQSTSGRGGSGSYPGSGYPSDGYRSTGYIESTDKHDYRQKRSPRGTTKKPTIRTTTARPPLMARGKVAPPFNTEIIEISVAIKPCKDYDFNLKIVGPGGTTMAEIARLPLPALSDLWDYNMPPLSQMLKVQIVPSKPPNLIIDPRYGVPAECANDLFEAVDLRMMRLENDLRHHIDEREKMLSHGKDLKGKLDKHMSSQLKYQFGCKCDSVVINLNTTVTKVAKKYPEAFGTYRYGGEQNGRPYYQKSLPVLFPVPPTGGFGGITSSGQGYQSSTTTTARPPASLIHKNYFLYWDLKHKGWQIGEKMDGKKVVLRTKKNSAAKCPADLEAIATWQYSGTLSWTDDKKMKAECGSAKKLLILKKKVTPAPARTGK